MKILPLAACPDRLDACVRLYEEAFPPAERRTATGWKLQIATRPRFDVHVLEDEAGFAGFISSWQLSRCRYVEHFAVLPERRSGGIGTKALAAFLRMCGDTPVVLEVELPESELAVRRIGFYRRNGFVLSELDYLQPPYEAGGELLPLRLMTYGEVERLDQVAREIHRVVYQYED